MQLKSIEKYNEVFIYYSFPLMNKIVAEKERIVEINKNFLFLK